MTDVDEALRRRALADLGPAAPDLALAALEAGYLEVERDVLAWEGTLGEVRGHRVTLRLHADLARELDARPAVVDALTAAVATAIAEVPGNALAELVVAEGAPPARGSPYRGRS